MAVTDTALWMQLPLYSEERKEEILKAYFERPSMRGIERVLA